MRAAFFFPFVDTNKHCVSQRSFSHCRVCEQRILFWLASWENCCSAIESVHVCWWRQVKSVSVASHECPTLTVITAAIHMHLWHFDISIVPCMYVCASVCLWQTGEIFNFRQWCHWVKPPLCFFVSWNCLPFKSREPVLNMLGSVATLRLALLRQTRVNRICLLLQQI